MAAALVLTALAVTAAPVGAAKPRRDMLPYTYEDVNHHFGGPGTSTGFWDTRDSYEFTLRPGEDAVSVMVLDDREGGVAGRIVQWKTDFEAAGASTRQAITSERFCTQTEKPVAVEPGVKVEVFIWKGTCEDGTPSVPTTGDIVMDFHKT